MHLTPTTTLMAILTTGIFLTLLTICLINRSLLIRFGYKLLALFVLFSFLRFVLPVEFPFTQWVALPVGISDVIAIFRRRLFVFGQQSASMWNIFECIWITGAVCGIFHYIISYIRASRYLVLYGKELTTISPYQELVAQICEEQKRPNHFRIIELPGLSTPMLFGIFSPKILLPERLSLDNTQAYYILRHEMTHHFHHDLILKCLIKIITLIYWWNPFCILLNRQTGIILEMHVDDSVTRSDSKETAEYMNCLIEYASNSARKAPFSRAITMQLLPKKDSDLVKRFYLMANNQQKSDVPLTVLISIIVLGIYIGSYMFIFEAYHSPQEENMGLPDDIEFLKEIRVVYDTDSYFIDNGDGTYDLYSNGKYLETMTTIDDFYPNAPVYTPENNPHKTE